MTLAQFSFQVPKPLQENYVRKRSSSVAALPDGSFTRMPESFEPFPEKALALPGPEPSMNLQIGMNPSPKRARSSPSNPTHNLDWMYMHHHDM